MSFSDTVAHVYETEENVSFFPSSCLDKQNAKNQIPSSGSQV